MFESLEETMKHDDQEASTPRERIVVWLSVIVVSLLVFGGLHMGIRLLD